MLARANTIQIIIQELAPSPAPIICIQQKQQHKTNTNISLILINSLTFSMKILLINKINYKY